MVFPGFTAADFDAYRLERAGSHAYNRPRLEVKQKTLALARELSERASAAGTALEVCASDEHPSIWNRKSVTAQWVFLWRDAAARKQLEAVLDAGRSVGATLSDPTPYFRHAFLAVYLDSDKVEMTFKIHGDALVDARNLRARVDDPANGDVLLQMLRALPEDFSVGITGGVSMPVRTLDAATLAASVHALTSPGVGTAPSGGGLFSEPSRSTGWWYVTRSVDRAAAVERGAGITETIVGAFEVLLPVYNLVAWSHTNDLLSLDGELQAARDVRTAHVTEDAAREAAWRAQHEADIHRRRELASVETRERMASLEPARPSAVHAAVQTVVSKAEASPPRPVQARPTPAAPKPAPIAPKPAPIAPKPALIAPRPAVVTPKPAVVTPNKPASDARPASAPRPAKAPAAPPPRTAAPVLVESEAPVVLGAQVRVRTGPFAGRVGTVTELDARGHVKVAFGPMSARLVMQELVTLAEV